MACVGLTGFESGSSVEIETLSGTASIQGTTKRTGDFALQANPATTATGYGAIQGRGVNGGTAQWALTAGYWQFYLRIGTLPASASEQCFSIHRAGAALSMALRVTSGGKLQVYQSDGTTQVGSDSGVTLVVDTWYRIIVYCEASATGAVTVDVDGSETITGTGDFVASNFLTARFGKATNRNGQTVNFYYDDIYVDDAGDPPAGAILRLDPKGAGAASDWATGTGSTFAEVDETPHDSDTTYIATSTSGQASTFDLDNIADVGIASGDTTNQVMSFAVVREEPSTTTALQLRLRSGSTNNVTNSVNLTTTYISVGKFYATDPATSAAWVTTALDSVEVGVEANAAAEHRCTQLCAFVHYTPAAVTGQPTMRRWGGTLVPIGAQRIGRGW